MKILILITVLIGAIWGTLRYYETIVLPPSIPDMVNQYEPYLEKMTSAYCNERYETAKDRYLGVEDANKLCYDEELVSDIIVNINIEKAYESYAKAFITWANSKFSMSVWYSDDHREMTSQISKLRRFDNASGVSLVAKFSQIQSELENVENVIKLYRQAESFCRNLEYVSLERSQKDIETSRTFLKHDKLKNNVSLCNRLLATKKILSKEHYRAITEHVDWFSQYWSGIEGGLEGVTKEAELIENEIDEYKKAYSVYGDVLLSTLNLENMATQAYTEAYSFYNNSYEYSLR